MLHSRLLCFYSFISSCRALCYALVILYAFSTPTRSLAQQYPGSLEVSVTNINPSEGKILMALFPSDKGFPRRAEHAIRKVELPAQEGAISFTFSDLPLGPYALVVLHDENGDKDLDTNFFGSPTEQYGFSNNAERTFGPPSFEEARVDVGTNPSRVEVKLHK